MILAWAGANLLFGDMLLERRRRHGRFGDLKNSLERGAEPRESLRAFDHICRVHLHRFILARNRIHKHRIIEGR
jgi:hypothetical protein